ncbi:obtusifoliol 14-alpha demethylase-like [Phragmites australis]|uniref:obtusifoliol 14-alpha demethylase-like n=1 Tax=Phragmites australis TaxID=29695 RepID=UPI002D782F86|nr:obtusifoliol 14-alpha demethylase-like [Phragmites australis]
MDMANGAVWFCIALVFVTAVITKVARGRTMDGPACNMPPPPPVVTGISIIGLLHTLVAKGFQTMIHEQYTKLGSAFTISLFGLKTTFLIGPEVSAHFYQGLDSEISHGNILEFTVPMLGKEVGYGVDITTRTEQNRFYIDALKPSKLRCHVGPMIQEVENYFVEWGQQGTVDLKQEFEQLLMLISGRCLLGKEVQGKMFNEFFSTFRELTDNSLGLITMLFPYAPIPMTRRRDRARARLSKMFTSIVRSRKSSNRVEEDVLQNLIDSRYKDGRPTTDAEVTGLMIAVLFAGKHSSSTTSTWTGARLLSHSQCLKAAVKEQQQIVSKYGDHIDYNTLLEMTFLHCCIKEALRMHPPAPTFLRKVHKNFTIRTREGHEYEIPRGHTIASPLVFNNNIPYIYKDPDVYDPDRFGPGREEDKVGGKFSYTAFSGGRHACPGEAYAYMQVKVIWSHLLRNFELKLVSSFPETDWGKVALDPKGKVMVSYKRRTLPGT